MRKNTAILVVLAGVATLIWAVCGGAAKVGEDVAIPGTMCCAACELGGSPDHKCGKECCLGCIRGGDSVLLKDGKGILYLLISRDKEKPVLTPERMELMGEKVTVKGIRVEKGELKGIYVDSIESGKEKAPAEKKEGSPERRIVPVK